MLLYYITDRRQLGGSASEQQEGLLHKICEAARHGVDFIQLRERDLNARELLQLALEARQRISSAGSQVKTDNSELRTRLLINSRLDVALASGADGIHLRGDDISAADARAVWSNSGAARLPGPRASVEDPGNAHRACFLVAVSCHTAEQVRRAESDGADFAVFAPVFEKGQTKGVGLQALRAACRGTVKAKVPEASPAVRLPVLALGGVTVQNARDCVEAGAAGIAGIRLFQENNVAEVVDRLRSIEFAKYPRDARV